MTASCRITGIRWMSTREGLSSAAGSLKRKGSRGRSGGSVSAAWRYGWNASARNGRTSGKRIPDEIEGIINKIGGWKNHDANSTGKTKVPLYGVQKTFVRETSETA